MGSASRDTYSALSEASLPFTGALVHLGVSTSHCPAFAPSCQWSPRRPGPARTLGIEKTASPVAFNLLSP